MQVENTQMLEGDFRLHQIMQLHINFYNLVLTWGCVYVTLSEGMGEKSSDKSKKTTMKSDLNGLLLQH